MRCRPAIGVLLALAAPAAAEVPCAERIVRDSADCCWPGQQWSKYLRICAGRPACPKGYLARGEACYLDCGEGRVASEETRGHCCWPGQVWSTLRTRCVGAPGCPPGWGARGDDCGPGCTPGQEVTADTAGRCCWPGQAWSERRQACVGVPRCPSDYETRGETCVPGEPEPPPRRPPTNARVSFVAGDGAAFRVTVGEMSCLAPCILDLEAGRHWLTAKGTETIGQSIVVAPGRAEVRLRTTRRWPWVVGPMVLTTALLAFVAAGAVFASGTPDRSQIGPTVALGFVGGFGLGFAIPLILSGRPARAEVRQETWRLIPAARR